VLAHIPHRKHTGQHRKSRPLLHTTVSYHLKQDCTLPFVPQAISSRLKQRLDKGKNKRGKQWHDQLFTSRRNLSIPEQKKFVRSTKKGGGQSHSFRFLLNLSIFFDEQDLCPIQSRTLHNFLLWRMRPQCPHKKTSRLNSSVLTGYGSSNLPSTLGCKIPKTPIVWFLPPRLSLIAAAWPGRKVGSVNMYVSHL
jgi:hypothetical protein